jgi:phosphoglycerate dehydrogenase-like enzyme
VLALSAALLEALEGGRLGGAALDVFAKEGAPLDARVRALARHPRVVCTPHLVSASVLSVCYS